MSSMSNFYLGQYYQNKTSSALWRCIVISDNKAYFKRLDEEKEMLVGDLFPEDYRLNLEWKWVTSNNIPQRYLHVQEEK